jgi:hypothetical protein
MVADVCIRWRTPSLVSASVRDVDGIVDVRWTGYSGWSCSCSDEYGCVHILAVRQLTAESS